MATAGYLELKAVLNYLYARHHGYGYFYYEYPDSGGAKDRGRGLYRVCSLTGRQDEWRRNGGIGYVHYRPRHASWCKLLVVADVFESCTMANLPNGSQVPSREVLLVHGRWVLFKGRGDDTFAPGRLALPWCSFLHDFAIMRAGNAMPSGTQRDESQ